MNNQKRDKRMRERNVENIIGSDVMNFQAS